MGKYNFLEIDLKDGNGQFYTTWEQLLTNKGSHKKNIQILAEKGYIYLKEYSTEYSELFDAILNNDINVINQYLAK